MIRSNFWQSLKKILSIEVLYIELKVALHPMYRIFSNFTKRLYLIMAITI